MSYKPPATPSGDIAVTESLTGAIFTDAAGQTISLSGEWTTYYNATTGAVDPHQNAYLALTATNQNGSVTTITDAYAPYATPMKDNNTGQTNAYELYGDSYHGGTDNALYFDYATETPTTLTKTLSSAYHSSISDGTNSYTLSNGGVITTVTLCFAAGTAIATPDGDAAIETLQAGNEVLLADGRRAAIRWIGRRAVATKFADPLNAFPICISAGALGDNLPRRDLLVSPCHAVLVGGLLVQAAALVNNVTILRTQPHAEVFTYYHIELAEHALIIAEGVASESFVDNVERMAFDNWDEFQTLFGDAPCVPEMDLPRVKSARQLPAAIRTILLERVIQRLAA